MNQATTRTMLVAVAVLFVACGALAGAAAADEHDDDDGMTIGEDVEVGDEDNGGEGGFECTGTPIDHDCDKDGEARAGPGSVDYEGFNGGSYEDGEYDFGDTFVVTGEDGDGAVVAFECHLEDEAPEDNPCPVTAEEYEGDPGNGTDDDQGNGDENRNGNGNGNDGGQGDDGDRGDPPAHASGSPNGSSASGASYVA